MNPAGLDVPLLLSGRQHKAIVERGVAEVLDLILLIMTAFVFVTVAGESSMAIALPAAFAYFVLAEWRSGQTVGKRMLGLRVVGPTGEPPTIVQSVVRNLVRPFEAFGLLGILVACASGKGQRIGDIAASTFVILGDELLKLQYVRQALLENRLQNSREVLPLTPTGAAVAREGIANSRSPEQTGLIVVASQEGVLVQYDLLVVSEPHWHWTSHGVTVSVPREIVDQYNGFVIDAKGDKLCVVRL